MTTIEKRASQRKMVIVFIGVLLGTAAVGWVLALGLGLLLAALLRGRGEFADLGGVVVGLFGGYPLGVWLGQVIVRRFYRGSLMFGLLGVLLGIGLTVLLSLVFHLNAHGNVLLMVYAVLVPLLGTVGYLLKR
jgi:hypothetical protein